MFPPIRFERFGKVLIEETNIAAYSKTLDTLRQIIGRIHQLMGCLIECNLVLCYICQAPEGGCQVESGVKQQPRNNKGCYDNPDIYHPQ